MTTLTNFLDRIANWKSLVLLLILYGSFPTYWLKNAEIKINQLADKTIGPIDLTVGYYPTRILQMVADYGPAARACYAQTELTADVAYPLTYCLLFAVVLTLLFRNKAYRSFRWVTLLPLAGLLFDYLENAAIVGLLTTYPAQSPTLAVLCEVAKLGKWLSLGLVVTLMLYGFYYLIMSKNTNKFVLNAGGKVVNFVGSSATTTRENVSSPLLSVRINGPEPTRCRRYGSDRPTRTRLDSLVRTPPDSAAPAQPGSSASGSIRPAVQLTGELALSTGFYATRGPETPRAPVMPGDLNGNLMLNTRSGWTIPVQLIWSSQNNRYSQPYNRVGVSPRYKRWLTLHGGYRNVVFSPLTLAGHVFLGVGVELNPGLLRVGAVVGRFNRAVNAHHTDPDCVVTFRRTGYCAKVGVGNERNYLDLILLRVADDVHSLRTDGLTGPTLSIDYQLTPVHRLSATWTNARNQGSQTFRQQQGNVQYSVTF